MGRFGVGASVVVAVLAMAASASAASGASPLSHDVDTRIGTQEGAADFGTGGGAGATYPGAVAPFGMVQLSPDTYPGVDNPAGGYSYVDSKIKGFSLTHLSGAGCSALSDIPLLPTTAGVDRSPSPRASYDVDPRYVAKYTHKGEVARPGDYRVTLNPGRRAIATELTATERAGALRIAFPRGVRRGSVLVNAGGSAMGNLLSDVRVDPGRREITGTIRSGGFCYAANRYTLHFVARFDRAFAASGTWSRGKLATGSRHGHDVVTDQPGPLVLQYKRLAGGPKAMPGNPAKGALAGAYASFPTDKPVVARVAISSVSVAGARANLAADARGLFAAMRTRATKAWASQIDRVTVTGGSTAKRRLMAASLYHAQVMPNVFSDVDGRYAGMDGKVHRAQGFDKYANISGWDTYRSQMPLMALLAPTRASDLVTSMVADQRESGGLPKWSVLNGQTNVMVGDPADLLIANAHAFGATGFDAKAALRAMVDGATVPKVLAGGWYVQRAGLADYLRLGYVGHEQETDSAGQTFAPAKVWGTASTTLEYALADFAIARMARAVGDAQVCDAFAARAGNWRNVFNPATEGTGLMAPRDAATGAFAAVPAAGGDGFVEGSAAQYTWFVPQDVAGLIAKRGGVVTANVLLEVFFNDSNAGAASANAFLGNEPTLLTPFVYHWLGRPSAGSAKLVRAMMRLYRPTPGGFPGNDDGGALSAWWAFGAMGLSPAVPGTDVMAITAPLFPRVRLRLAHGTLDVRAPGASLFRRALVSARLDGKAYVKNWIAYADLARGDHRLDLTPTAVSGDAKFGTSRAAVPPSFGGSAACR
jgi:predicted alpha-1,2-mannosidase